MLLNTTYTVFIFLLRIIYDQGRKFLEHENWKLMVPHLEKILRAGREFVEKQRYRRQEPLSYHYLRSQIKQR